MKSIAVASDDRMTVTAHVGGCRRFWLYAVEDGAVLKRTLLELEPTEALHAMLVGSHPIMRASVVIAAGMGDGMRQRLARNGVRGVVTSESNPDRAVRKYLLGTLDGPEAAVCTAEVSVA